MRGYAESEKQGERLSHGPEESIVGSDFSTLTAPETRLPLAVPSQAGQRLPQGLVLHPGVDFGRADVSVAEGSLHQSQVARPGIELRGEGVPQRVDREWPGDAGDLEPVPEPQLDLPCAEPPALARAEQGAAVGGIEGSDVAPEHTGERSVDEHGVRSAALGHDSDRALAQVDIAGVQANKRAEPDARAEQEREHGVVSAGDRAVRTGDGIEQPLRLVGRQVARHSPVSRRRADKPGRVVSQVAGVGEEAEADAQGCLCPVDRERSPRAVPVSQEACEHVRRDGGKGHVPAEPALELAQVSQVSLPGALAPTVSPELSVEAGDGGGEPHGVTSSQGDSQATSMKASLRGTVKPIVRRSRRLRQLHGASCSTFARVAATRPFSAPISEKVAVYAQVLRNALRRT